MKKMFLLAAICMLLSACGNDYGDPVTKDYSISSDYQTVEVSSAFNVTVSKNVTEAKVTMPEKLHEKLVLKVTNGSLKIGLKPGTIDLGSFGNLTVVLPVNPSVSAVEVSGASSFEGNLQGLTVEIEASGASTYRGFVDADNVELEISGTSTASVSGTCRGEIDLEVSGASRVNAGNCDAVNAKGDISGASTADVTICSNLNVTLSGASTLTYGLVSSDCNPTINCPCTGSSQCKPR